MVITYLLKYLILILENMWIRHKTMYTKMNYKRIHKV